MVLPGSAASARSTSAPPAELRPSAQASQAMTHRTPARSGAGACAAATASVSIDRSIRRTLEKFLGAEGYEVSTAHDAPGAIAAAPGVELVLLDLGLPGGSGFDVLSALASHERPPVVVVVTARDDMQSTVKAIQLGAYEYLVKPVDIDRLREVVKQYHAKADGQCYVDVSFHLVITDTTESVLGQELPALVNDGYTSFKVFMTYEGLALSDLEMLNVMAVARETGALVMVHAENYDAIRFLTDRLERAGLTAPHFHAAHNPSFKQRPQVANEDFDFRQFRHV